MISDFSKLDAAVARVRDAASRWARAPIDERLAVANAMLAGVVRTAERSVRAACEAKALAPGTQGEGEEWLAGPYCNVRLLRLTIRQLEHLRRHGNTRIGPVSRAADGRLVVQVFPSARREALVFPGLRAEVRLLEVETEASLDSSRAGLYRGGAKRDGRVCLVLGAGNVNSIPSTDVISKLFAEGKVCVLKMNPVNAYIGPLIEEAFSAAVSRGLLSVVYGGAEEGGHLCEHAGVDEIHITGSDRTHDLIVWGPPGPEREARKARGEPILDKEITSELGNVSPVIVVPGPYSGRELAFQARSIAGAVVNNGSFNCNAAKMLVTPGGSALRRDLLAAIEALFENAPARKAYYPGAEQRFQRLTERRENVKRIGGGPGTLPWTLITGLDPDAKDEPAFQMEPFCSILSEAVIEARDPLEFLARAVSFANDRLWGTLAATIVVHPATLADPALGPAVERAIADLRYGTVALNIWPAVGFAMGSTPWGAFPGSPLDDIRSGRGFVHNTAMIENIEKAVIRHPVASPLKLPYFPDHRCAHLLGRRLTAFEEKGDVMKLPGVISAALCG